jgi:hypothetical protein
MQNLAILSASFGSVRDSQSSIETFVGLNVQHYKTTEKMLKVNLNLFICLAPQH